MKVRYRLFIGRNPDTSGWMVRVTDLFDWQEVDTANTRDAAIQAGKHMIIDRLDQLNSGGDTDVPPPGAELETLGPYEVAVWEEDIDMWRACVPALGGLATTGESRDEVLREITDIYTEMRAAHEETLLADAEPDITDAELVELEFDPDTEVA